MRAKSVAVVLFGLALPASVFVSEAAASESVMWGCALPGQRGNVLYLVSAGPRSYVKFSGQRIPAQQASDGSGEQWQWGGSQGNSVKLRADGLASYYEAGQTTTPKQQFRCKRMG